MKLIFGRIRLTSGQKICSFFAQNLPTIKIKNTKYKSLNILKKIIFWIIFTVKNTHKGE